MKRNECRQRREQTQGERDNNRENKLYIIVLKMEMNNSDTENV